MATQVAVPSAPQRHWSGAAQLLGGHSQCSISNPSDRLTSSSYMSTNPLPSFSQPFMSAPRISAPDLYVDTALDSHHSPNSARTSTGSTSSSTIQYSNPPISTASSSPSVAHHIYDQQFLNQGLLSTDFPFSTASSPVNPVFSQSSFDLAANSFIGDSVGVRSCNIDNTEGGRRSSQAHTSVVPPLASSQDVYSIDQDTPRGAYATTQVGNGSSDSYTFSSAHSSTSSISSSAGGNFSSLYSSTVDPSSALSEYPDADVSIPASVMRASQPMMSKHSSIPAQASMMTQFSSKVSSSVQKKHACKICEKRFTRPSSLQTHVYSHTGEKPYQCTHPGCGRCFSVVSNLRRHQKIHRNRERDSSSDSPDSRSDSGSPVSHVGEGDD